jgi:hypothetical protein
LVVTATPILVEPTVGRLRLALQPANRRLWLGLQPTNARLWLALQPTNGRLYGAITWSAITALSEQSIANSVQTLEFPDFTAGLWKQRKPIFAFEGTY